MRKLFTLFSLCIALLSVKAQTQVQFINNSADSLMYLSDVYMNGVLTKDNLTYKTATGFLSFAGDTTYTIAFRSEFDSTKIVSLSQTLQAGKKYVIVLNGVTADTAFQLNPDSLSNQLSISVIDQSLATVPSAGQVSVAVLNGSTDAPAFDLYSNDTVGVLLVDNDSLNQFSFTTFGDSTIRLYLKTIDGAFNISTYQFSLTGLNGQVLTALTSGFLAPGSNKNGPNFNFYIVDSSGNVYTADNVSLVHQRNELFSSVSLYPNPARTQVQLDFTLSHSGQLSYEVIGLNGAVLQNAILPAISGTNTVRLSVQDLAPGMYFLRLKAADSAKTISFIVQ